MKKLLLVDGYNIIGDWPELRELQKRDLAGARDVLIEKMAEYQAFTGIEVTIIFDAHMVPGLGKKYTPYSLDVIYTKEKESADERIERLVHERKRIDRQIYVATSDFVEQRVIFASGAFRKSARELRTEVEQIEKGISTEVEQTNRHRRRTKLPISDEIAEKLEMLRRGKK
ncbi:NYN domain-containing protein [Paenalkalicoccus suaedae]|uniref:NYN domain-containing protein n=1 Tax=Paenalkalicoccus suaedae TaxID=2592382 RepID=A0A859FAA0_9BACI|nr:NYN domain-containing protein [Paenalkalicoccus suaedae]QKS69682.1 NYN domain-containing protein [Paenalkalicoccus suaedae]